MKKYDYFLLDWDGNLAKTLDIWIDAIGIVVRRRGINVTTEQIAISLGAMTHHMIEWGITDPEATFQEINDLGRIKLPDVELYPDALEVLESLQSAGKKIALITTSSHDNIVDLLAKYDLHELFDVVVTYEDTTGHKPDAEPLEFALAKLGGTKDRAVMVGDSDKDLGAAVNAGVDSILFYPDEHHKFYNLDTLKQHNPTYIFDDFKDILTLI
jgi:pyrophosphatase PpaX